MAKVYTLKQLQRLPIDIETAWEFFSNPRNLATITPPSLAFECLDGFSQMTPGMMLMYRVRPLPGFRTTWVTEITHVDRPHLFVDEQRVGPYRMWHHQHRFRAIAPGADSPSPDADDNANNDANASGVEMEDEIHYILPFGPLGRLFHRPVVSMQLTKIFEYRRTKLIEMFGQWRE